MKELHAMTLAFVHKATFKSYDSVVLKRSWNGIGEMDLVVGGTVQNAAMIAENDILYFDKDYHKAYIVERIETEQTPAVYNIKAQSIDSILADYITAPPSGEAEDIQNGTREEIVRAWVTTNCIPAQEGRPNYTIALGTYRGLGSTITDRTRYKNMASEIARVLEPQDLGWGLVLDIPNKRFIFNVYQGTDRTQNASGYSPRVYFGMKYGNIQNPRQVCDQIGSKTVAYVGGQGTGLDRTVARVADEGASRIRETFVDARDTDSVEELMEKGSQALAESAPIKTFEFEVLDRQFKYETDYDLGDFVTVVVDKGNSENLQIRHITEVYERGRVHVVPEFGKPEQTPKDLLGGISARVGRLESSESKVGADPTTLLSEIPDNSVGENGNIVFVYASSSYHEEVNTESFGADLGNWSDVGTFAWTRQTGSTPSSNTGPAAAQDGSYYIFVETSSGGANAFGNESIIEKSISHSQGPITALEVDFYYHQYGTEQGTLYLEGWDGNGWNQFWSSSGDQGNQWNHASVQSTVAYSKIRFRNVAAGGFYGDVALDKITVTLSSQGIIKGVYGKVSGLWKCIATT